ncbi:hypothetical protein [Solwaraspora sp. WMMA2101]|uniref:hypothetical protein n=1 Tax=Solwaraspora sp. WMMA2101 TaxID=3404124 RepID=UPI003B95C651
MNERHGSRRAAVAALVRRVLTHLAASEGKPRIGRMIDNQRWWRHGQETFLGIRPQAWDMPDDVPIVGWLDKFAEMADVRQSYATDLVLRDRVDAMIGAAGTLQARNFAWLLVQHVIEPMVLATATYEFDDTVFDRFFEAFDRGLASDQVHMVEFLPLNGFDSNEVVILLPDGLVLRRMTDRQMGFAIDQLAVPRMVGGSVNSVRISRFDQWALTITRTYPVVAGHGDHQAPAAPAFPTLDGSARRVVTALRLVCGGSVVATRPLLAQSDDEFPIVPSYTAIHSAFDSADNERPTLLMTDGLGQFRAVYTALAWPHVEADQSLQVAIRRLVLAGSRNTDSDRLIDLSVSAEALFIKRANLPKGTKGDKIAAGAANLLATEPDLSANNVEAFMKTLYQARNAEIHGDGQPYASLHLVSGSPATSLREMVDDAERIMRRAVLLILAIYASTTS